MWILWTILLGVFHVDATMIGAFVSKADIVVYSDHTYEDMLRICELMHEYITCTHIWPAVIDFDYSVHKIDSESLIRTLYKIDHSGIRGVTWEIIDNDAILDYNNVAESAPPFINEEGSIFRIFDQELEMYSNQYPYPVFQSLKKHQTNAPTHLLSLLPVRDVNGNYPFTSGGEGSFIYLVGGRSKSAHTDFRDMVTGLSRLQSNEYISPGVAAIDLQPCVLEQGTYLASVAAGTVYGTAKRASIVEVAVTPGNCDSPGYVSDILNALAWTLSKFTDRLIPRAPSIVVIASIISVGKYSSAIERIVNTMVSSGMIVIVAAGDQGEDACSFVPSRLPNVITVGALDGSSAWHRSNDGPCVNIWAPGTNVIGAAGDSSSGTMSQDGTATAASIVSGLVAIYKSENPAASINDIRNWIHSTSKKDESLTPIWVAQAGVTSESLNG